MISGFDKYFQIVRCFRDEDLRADRQPEFTQIDLEMTYPQPEQVFDVVEGFLAAAFEAAGTQLETPFPRMTYDQAIRAYGSDKPDLRLPPLTDVREAFAPEELEKLGIRPGLPVAAVRIPGVGELSRKERDEIKTLLCDHKDAKVFEDIRRLEKNFPEAVKKIRDRVEAGDSPAPGLSSRSREAGEGPAFSPSDLIVLVAGSLKPEEHRSEGGVKPEVKQHDYAVSTAAGALRLALGQKYAERHKLFAADPKSPAAFRWLWVTDFPMFEYDERMGQWSAAHHPFTSPHEQDLVSGKLESDPGAVRALAYDVVLNGVEIGSGSIRIHRQDVQKRVFRALGMSDDEARSRFGFFLDALEYGTPPHGGIALGLDRIVMMLAGAGSLREVIPFPKTARAVDLMVDAPTPVSEAQLRELGIEVSKSKP
jgi:aspartyl-tRNA synthetase